MIAIKNNEEKNTFDMSKLWMSGIDFNALTVYDLYEFIQIYIRFEKMNPENEPDTCTASSY